MEAYCALAFLKAHNRIHNKTYRLPILLKMEIGREKLDIFFIEKTDLIVKKLFVSDEK